VNVTDPEEAFEEIWEKPHYSPNEPSRTMYQVDQTLTYIEEKLIKMHAAFVAKGLITT